jgi:two-component system NarL family response regulator
VVGAAADGPGALALLERTHPDVMLLDWRLPGVAGVELARSASHFHPRVRILVLTSCQSDEDVNGALAAGARGYLTRDSSGDDLLAAIHALQAGQRFLSPAIAERLAAARTRQELTRRERQVLEHIADGASNREVSETLGISQRTVEVYVSSILSKFGARSRTEAVSMALHHGLLPAFAP